MDPYYVTPDDRVTVHHGDCLDVLRTMPDESVDSVVTDPPYSLTFMGKSWDAHDDHEDSGFGYWLAGFIDGEGCFLVKGHSRGTYAPSFQIKVRRDDRAALVAAQRFVGAGQVADVDGGESNPQARWVIQDREGCQRLVDVLDKYPLRAKKRLDYLSWREAVCEWTDRPRGNRWHGAADQSRMEALRARTADVKGYVEPAWSGNDFQDWCRLWAAECLRVLKPGGHMVAFGGTRTYHRLACAIEDAGFEVRDSLMWLYGCLTPDVDVLTEHGWVPGIDVAVGDRVAQWNPSTEAVTLAPVLDTFRAPWDGPMRVLRNADTDQLLTPNHRVYHQRYDQGRTATGRVGWTGWQVTQAQDVPVTGRVRLPVSGVSDGPGIGGEDYAALLGWVWTEGGFDLSGTGVRIYQSSVNQGKCDEIAALLDRVAPGHKRYDYERTYTRRDGAPHTYTAVTWYFSGPLAERVRADLPGKRPTYPLLWRMTAAEVEAFVRAAMLGDGSGWGGTSPQFYQKHEDDLVWFQTALHLSGRAGKVGMRRDRAGGSVSMRRGGTTELQRRHLRTDTEPFTGEVWCVRVPSGAFVARRNGRVFVTGNSGFPKSLNVSKAIDKAAPATDDARAWAGWGTALKPSHEPIVLARKPLSGTVAGNVLAYGTGALNIDGTRVGFAGAADEAESKGKNRHADFGSEVGGNEVYGDYSMVPARNYDPTGRWPANVVLSHADGCRQVGAVEDSRPANRPKAGFDGREWTESYEPGPGQPLTWTTVAVWECVDGCPVAELDAQSGTSKDGVASGKSRGFAADGYVGGTGSDYNGPPQTYGGEGGASRFFPQFGPPFRYVAKANSSERPKVRGARLRLRADLTPEQVGYVVERLRAAGVEVD